MGERLAAQGLENASLKSENKNIEEDCQIVRVYESLIKYSFFLRFIEHITGIYKRF